MTASSAREAARQAVTTVRERRAWARDIVPEIVGRATADAREAASATRLAYGTIQSRGTLDEALDARTARPRRIEPKVRDALDVAAYEILFTDTPHSASVDQGVELVRTVRPAAAGLANAVLRRLAEDAAEFPWGDIATDVAALARAHAHPLWLTERLICDLGRTTAARVLEANNSVPPLYLALNPFRGEMTATIESLRSDHVDPAPGPLAGCLVAGDAANAVNSDALARGAVLVSDAAAQLVCALTPRRPGGRVVEIGSGRGTKTALWQAANDGAGGPARISAVDVHDFKSDVLAARMAFLGVPGVTPVSADATDPEALARAIGGAADAVMIDAPCSGLGTLRRHPEHRWRVSASDVDALAHIGARILKAASSLVDPGGFVVYSTCTLTRQENAEVIGSFLDSRAGRSFEIDPLGSEVPDAWQYSLTSQGFVQTLPTCNGPDGHFVARLRRQPR
jgi:16S rRNA (cytosine967-C5)-methyltransferase